MTCPTKNPFKLFFLPGVCSNNGLPAHVKREYGWLPNAPTLGRRSKRKRKTRGKKTK